MTSICIGCGEAECGCVPITIVHDLTIDDPIAIAKVCAHTQLGPITSDPHGPTSEGWAQIAAGAVRAAVAGHIGWSDALGALETALVGALYRVERERE